ncbi:hypothetical protein ACS0TY_024122 [Phlomoides rotata]
MDGRPRTILKQVSRGSLKRECENYCLSGISWNSTTSMIDVGDEGCGMQLDGPTLRLKGFILRHDHTMDRATRENAVDPIDLINDMYRTVDLEQEGDTRDKFEQIPSQKLHQTEDECE